MKSRISALMDGELEARAAAESLAALTREGEAREAWRTYHLISDALRETRVLSDRFAGSFAARLAEEPTVFAPAQALASGGERLRRFALSAAASVAAAALVGWLAFAPWEDSASVAPVAVQTPTAVVPEREVAQVPLPSQANDYLLAHQGYSPRNSLQGMAPYVRMVSGELRAGKQ